MSSIELIESLISRFPAVAREAGSVAVFWERIDSAMEAIWAAAAAEGTTVEIEVRYVDLVEMVNDAGLLQSDCD